jgi:lactose/L-arabinose transport system substrate-binding protein
MKLKRTFLSVLSSVMIMSMLSACSSGGSAPVDQKAGDKPKEQAAGNDIKGEITVASWNDAADALEAEIPGFNKKYPNIKVNVQRVTSKYDKIIPPLTAGTGAPDIIQTQQRDLSNFLMKFPDQFVDLSDKLNSHKDEFAKAAWVSVLKDDKPFGIPWDLGPTAVWYRKDFFEKAGIDPKTLTTWDKYVEAGKTLNQKLPDVKMVALDLTGTDTSPDVYNILFNQQGGAFYNDKKEIHLAQDASYNAINTIKKFKDENIALNAPTWDDRVRAVVNGKTASMIYPIWYAGTIRHQAEDQKGKWGVIPLPAFKEGGPNQANLGGSALAITKQSKNPEAAWKFIEYSLMTNEGEDVQMKFGLFPSWEPYYKSEGMKKQDEFFGFPLAEFFGTVSDKIPPLEYGPHFLDFRKPLEDAYGNVLTGKMSPEQAYKQAEEESSKASGIKIAQ